MLPKSQFLRALALLFAGTLLLSAVTLAYAHCGKCAVDAKAMADDLKSSKMMLAPAILLAEQSSKGTAVKAACHRHAYGTFVEVHCVSGEKLVAVAVDVKSGKVLRSGEVATLEDSAAEGAAQPGEDAGTMSDTDVQAQLDKVAGLTKAGKFDQAMEILQKLEELNNVSQDMQSRIEAARTAYDVAKAAQGKLPGFP